METHPVLVVEDDADIREALVEILQLEGYAVFEAGHGEEALAQLRAGCKPCVIVLDMMMPVMDGWAFCEEKDKDPALASIPLVVVSAVAAQDPRNACVRAVDHLPKPIDIGKLLATVESYC
jgi:CheY-like chemotaxis protein